VWDMEMVSDYKPKPKVIDTIKKMIDTAENKSAQKKPVTNTIKKDSAALIQKKKKKITRPKNGNNT